MPRPANSLPRPTETAAPELTLRPFRVLTGRERRARSWSIFWGVAILPSLMLTLAATWRFWWPALEGFLHSM